MPASPSVTQSAPVVTRAAGPEQDQARPGHWKANYIWQENIVALCRKTLDLDRMLSGVISLRDLEYFANVEFWQLWPGVALYHPPTNHPCVTPNTAAGIGCIIQPQWAYFQSLSTFYNSRPISYQYFLMLTSESIQSHRRLVIIEECLCHPYSWGAFTQAAMLRPPPIGLIGQGEADQCPHNLYCNIFSRKLKSPDLRSREILL